MTSTTECPRCKGDRRDPLGFCGAPGCDCRTVTGNPCERCKGEGQVEAI